jgi:hypothetical protein
MPSVTATLKDSETSLLVLHTAYTDVFTRIQRSFPVSPSVIIAVTSTLDPFRVPSSKTANRCQSSVQPS